MFSAKFDHKRGNFVSTMQQRQRDWAKGKMAARISMPPGDEYKWWVWTEFGTASLGDAGRASGHTYTITAKNVAVLRYPQGGEYKYRASVTHPGIRPHRMIAKILDRIDFVAGYDFHEACQEYGLDFVKLRNYLLDAIMPKIKNMITESMAQELGGGTREDGWGRLHGETAAAAFDRDSFIRNTGS